LITGHNGFLRKNFIKNNWPSVTNTTLFIKLFISKLHI